LFDVSLLDRCPPEPAAEPACRSCTILLDPIRPGREPVSLPGGLGDVCEACYETIERHLENGLTLPAALACATWGAADI
jgi:hypothetical protein